MCLFRLENYVNIQILVAAWMYFGHVTLGFATGWMSPVVPKLQTPDQTPLDTVITHQDASWIGSLSFVGGIIGPHTTSYLSNTIGRKPSLLLGGFFTALSFIMYALASSLNMIFAGRIFAGFGLGIFIVTNLTYIEEISSTPVRGMLLSLMTVFDTLGILLVYSVGPYVSYDVVNYIGVTMSILFICGIFYIPESPLFLAIKGHDVKLMKTLVYLSREEDIDTIRNYKDEKDKSNKWTEIITVKSNRKALFLTVSLHVLQQSSGISVIPMYASTIFGLADLTLNPSISTIIIGASQLLSGCLTPYFIERSGRRILLLISTTICCISLALLGTFFYLHGINSPFAAHIKWLPLVTLIFFSVGYGFGLITIPGTLIGEMFTPRVRSVGASVAFTIGWLWGFVIVSTFGYMLQYGAHVVFWFYACACAAAFTFTLTLIPETKGKSLFEIQEMLSG